MPNTQYPIPNRVPEPYASMSPPHEIMPWPGFPDPLTNKPYAQKLTRQRWGTDGWKWDRWQPIVGRYLGDISLLDVQIGRVLRRLDALGLRENIDLARTLVELMGGEVPPSFIGTSLLNRALGKSPYPEETFSQYFGTQQGLYSSRALIGKRFKYIFKANAEDELYDLHTDPGEKINLASIPEQAKHMYSLKLRLGEWMKSISDPLSPPLFDGRKVGKT